jgi:glycosyltransferase involved in cell wall biosynthesis
VTKSLDRPRRALVFAPSFAPSFFSEALVNSKLALAMLNDGWDITVFSARGDYKHSYVSGWGNPWSRLQDVRRDVAAAQSGFTGYVERASGAIRTGHPVDGARWAECTARAALDLHRDKRFDVVLSRSTSCVAHLPALLFRAALGAKAAPAWVANWNDPPGHLFPPPYSFPISSLKRWLKDRYLRAAAAAADVNTFPSDQLRDYLATPLGLDAAGTPDLRRGVVIPHVGLGWRPSRGTVADPARYRICHAGNLSSERDPTLFFKAFAAFARRHPGVRFEIEIVGRIASEFEAAAAEHGLQDIVRSIGGLPFLECLERLADADLQLLIEASCDRGVFLPSKLVDYIEVGKPILALSPQIGVVHDLIEVHRFAQFAVNDSVVGIEAALERCFVEHRRSSDRSARAAALETMRARVRPSRIINDIWEAALASRTN